MVLFFIGIINCSLSVLIKVRNIVNMLDSVKETTALAGVFRDQRNAPLLVMQVC